MSDWEIYCGMTCSSPVMFLADGKETARTGSFSPEPRHRRAQVADELQKTLELANIKLDSVVSDITSVSATEMLQHIVAGTGTPERLSELGRGALRKKREALRRALSL